MRAELEISSGIYSKPVIVAGEVLDEADKMTVKWVETDPVTSSFCLVWDKKNASVSVTRAGNISSTMIFEAGKETSAVINTAYGDMNFTIVTDYINFPSLLNDSLEMAYSMLSSGEETVKNTFSVKRLLQKQKV